jgi:hypothetical protein
VWTFSNLADINCCFVDQSLAPAMFSDTDVTLFYENVGLTTQNLRALHWNGSSWQSLGCVGEPFVQDDIVGANASAAVILGRPHVTYYDAYSSTFGGRSGVVHSFFDGTTWTTSMVGIHAGAPTVSINSGTRLKVYVGDASITAGTATHDLVLASPSNAGVSEPADTSCA